MPTGSFIVELDSQSKPTIRALHFEDDAEKMELSDNIILQLRMGHSEKKLFTLLTKSFSIVSYVSTFRREKEYHQVITGVILKSSDNPNDFRNPIKMMADEVLQEIFSDDAKLLSVLQDLYEEYLESSTVLLNQKELEARLKDRIKRLNKEGKFDDAQKMLELMKKIPKKLFEANKNAEKALSKKDLDTAEKELKKAVKFAKELGEKEQAKILSDRAKIVKQIPRLQEKRRNEIKKAREGLRKDQFEVAYKHFKNAADISKKLMDSDGSEEYKLKADALAKFAEVHKRFRRK